MRIFRKADVTLQAKDVDTSNVVAQSLALVSELRTNIERLGHTLDELQKPPNEGNHHARA